MGDGSVVVRVAGVRHLPPSLQPPGDRSHIVATQPLRPSAMAGDDAVPAWLIGGSGVDGPPLVHVTLGMHAGSGTFAGQ